MSGKFNFKCASREIADLQLEENQTQRHLRFNWRLKKEIKNKELARKDRYKNFNEEISYVHYELTKTRQNYLSNDHLKKRC